MTMFEVFGLTITWEQVLGSIPGVAFCYWCGWLVGRRYERERGDWW